MHKFGLTEQLNDPSITRLSVTDILREGEQRAKGKEKSVS